MNTSSITDHVKNICRIGQLHLCCKYLVMSPTGFECAKLDSLKNVIDKRNDMTAKGDNCEGKNKGVLNFK